MLYAHKLTTTGRALENSVALKVLEQGAACHLHILISSSFFQVKELKAPWANMSPFP